MIKKVFEASINYVQIMDNDGNIDEQLLPKEIDDQKILEMYKQIVFARMVDAKCMSLQRQGRIATYAPIYGEEATQIGSAMAMNENDIFVPNFRQHAVFFNRKFPLELFFIYEKAFEEGTKIPENINAYPWIVPVSTQILHAVGIAYAQKFKNTDSVVLTYIGDGGTSEGNFYEGMNFAGIFKVPIVIIIENNQWAISVPRSKQTNAETLAQKGIAAGIDCIQVDGNDVIGVYKVVKDAIASAKNSKPVLIEAITYRLGVHTTSDDPTKYRDENEVNEWKLKEPLIRLNKFLVKKQLWDNEKQKAMELEFSKTIDEAVEKAESFKPDPKSMFEHVYSFMPDILKQEEDEFEMNNFFVD
ncbi:MAG: pyruvate dehydrogenase (acetyl-transferring) E1 component subunit alpha [Candidatus Marsarchaeota archaeon]|nr:pyruvate dehydrogenase (acetyl-transferring) E1 component subunit alpha [Candidatus Marsarchaeota archaeon]